MQHDIARARWWLAYPVALLLLAILDAFLGAWHPLPERLPDQFSPAYLHLVLRDAAKTPPATLVLGDSVLWGYKIAPQQTAVAALQQELPDAHLINLAYEGGSTPNSSVLLDEALASGIRVRGVVVNLNVKEFNANDSAYRTLHPS
ncbi:MAG: hypothetical protein KGN02_09700, partial [bacterium]|nr:hypothetical protein [bacterium]